MPKIKLTPKKIAAGALLVGAPIGATLGIVYGTKDNVTERQDLPVVTFGDKYFNAVIKDDTAFAPSHVLSPEGGNNLYSSYVDLLATNDIEHYSKLIKQKSKDDGGGMSAPLYSKDINISGISSIEEMNAEFIEVNDKLNKIATEYNKNHPKLSLGIVTAPLIKDKKRVIQIAAYELKSNSSLESETHNYFKKYFDFDTDQAGQIDKYIDRIDARAGADGFDWSKEFMQVLISKTIPSSDYFEYFGMDKHVPDSDGDDEILPFILKYATLPNGDKVPVKCKDENGEHFVLTIHKTQNLTYPSPSAPKNVDSKIIDKSDLKTDEYIFDGQIRDSNGDYDFKNNIYLSKNMISSNIVPQIESSIDWKSNNWFLRATFNKVNSDSIIISTPSLDSVKNPEAVSLKSLNVSLSHFGSPKSQSLDDSRITVDNLIKYDNKENDYVTHAPKTVNGEVDRELAFNSNHALRAAITSTLTSLKDTTPAKEESNLCELFRNAFLGKPNSKMLPQFSHYLKRNLISDGLSILGDVMPGILGPVDSFKSIIKMIETQKTSLEKIEYNGKEYQGDNFLREVVFSDTNIKNIFAAMEQSGSSVNGLSFVYNSIIKFGIAEQRTPGVLSQGTKNENDAQYIVESSNDWLWSSITDITALSAAVNPSRYSLYNLYSLFSGLNIVDNSIMDIFKSFGIKETTEVDDGDSVISTLFSWASENKILPEGTTVQAVISDVTGTIKKLIANLYNANILARKDEADGMPYDKRHKFVSFPTSLIEKVITLIPGVDWTKIKNKETNEQRENFVDFIKHASLKDNVEELRGDDLLKFAILEFNMLNSEKVDLQNLNLPSVTDGTTIDGATALKLRSFIIKISEGNYLDKISIAKAFDLAQNLKVIYEDRDVSVLKGYVIPNNLPKIDPQDDVRKAAVAILGDPYTLISIIDTIKGNGMTIEDFMDKILPDSSLDVTKMIPTLLETITSKHNLDILSIDRILNVVSRMGLLPSIVDKILSPSMISTASTLIGDGRAKEIYDAFNVIYKNGLYIYFTSSTGLSDFENDVQPIVEGFKTKLKLISDDQYKILSDEAKENAVSDKQFEEAIFDILEYGLGDSTNKISDDLKIIGNVISNSLELPSTMIDIPKLVEAVNEIVEDGSIEDSLGKSLARKETDPKTAFEYLFDMLHDSGSTIIYSMLPEKLKTAMDAFPTEDLMEITQHLLYGFKTETDFTQFLIFIKGLLPRDDNGKTIFDKKLSELSDDVPSEVDLATSDTVEQLLMKAYRGEALIDLGITSVGKDEISKYVSEILHNGIIHDPAKTASDIYAIIHANAPVKLWIITIWHLNIWNYIPDNMKTIISEVLGDKGKNLEDILQVAKNAIENPLNTITANDVEKILNTIKAFMPNLNISQDLIDSIFNVVHNGLNIGAGKTNALDASKEVDKLLGSINSLVTIPDMLKAPIKNLLIGKDTFATLAVDLATDIETTLNANPFAIIKHVNGEFSEIKTEIDEYDNLVDSINTYRDMISDMPSLKTTDPQKLTDYKTTITDLINKLNTLKTKVETDTNDQDNGTNDIKGLFTNIDAILGNSLVQIDGSAPELLTGTYTSLDGKQHKYSEFNIYEFAQWKTLKAKVEAIRKLPMDSLDKIKDIKTQLGKIYADIQVTKDIPTTFNNSIQKALDAYNAYKVWLTDSKVTGGAYIEPRISDSGYDAIYNYFKGSIDKMEQSITAANVLAQEQAVKDAVAKFNKMVKGDKALDSDEGNAINKVFEKLTSGQISQILATATHNQIKSMYGKLNSGNQQKLFSSSKVSSKVSGADGLDTSITDILKGKTLDWILDNVRAGQVKRHWYTKNYIAFDFFNQEEHKNSDDDIKAMNFAPIRTWKYANGPVTAIKANDGNNEPSNWGRILVLMNGNHGYKDFSHSHTLVDFFQHVYGKDFNWLIDNGWI